MRYVDASVAVAYYLPDPLSDTAQAAMRHVPDLALSDWAELEIASVVARLARAGSITEPEARLTIETVSRHLAGSSLRRVLTSTHDIAHARELVSRLDLPLRAQDAVHLAIVTRLELSLLTADRHLARCAKEVGAKVELVEA